MDCVGNPLSGRLDLSGQIWLTAHMLKNELLTDSSPDLDFFGDISDPESDVIRVQELLRVSKDFDAAIETLLQSAV